MTPPWTLFKILKMIFATFLFQVLLFTSSPFAMAQDGLSHTPTEANDKVSAVEAYQKGLKLFQEKEFKSASEQFHSAYEVEPHNPYVLYNWGLSEFELGNKGMALAAWRKALFLEPDLTPAVNAIEFLTSTTSIGAANFHHSYWEIFRQKVLARISVNQSIFISLIFLATFGWLAIRYFGQRRLAVEEELPLPPIPWLAISLLLVFIVLQSTAVLKIYDYFTPRATVITSTVTVKSAPTSDASSLFEIYEGSEVLLKRKITDWSQVKYPGGLTGWVESQNLFHTSGREL